MTFGKELKKIRLKRNRTQKFMALQLNMSTTSYYNIEHDNLSARSKVLYNILDNDYLSNEEQLMLAEKYQEKVDEEWTEEDDKKIEREMKAEQEEVRAEKRKEARAKKEAREKQRIKEEEKRRLEYRRRKNITYLTKEVYKPKPDRERIKRAVPKSVIQKLF